MNAVSRWLLVPLFCLQADPEPAWKFARGTSWTYSKVVKTYLYEARITVLSADEKQLTVETKDYIPGDEENASTDHSIHKEDGGYLVWIELKGDKPQDPLRIYKRGSKEGDTWDAGSSDPNSKATARHRGRTDVTVPAGTFKDCVKIDIESDGKNPLSALYSMTLYLSPKAGLVKMTMTFAGKPYISLELKQFKEGKP